MTLTCNPVFKKIVSRAYLLYYLCFLAPILRVDASWDGGVSLIIVKPLSILYDGVDHDVDFCRVHIFPS